MKTFSKRTKTFAIILGVAIALAIGICVVSYGVYGKIYFFNGYAITGVLWVITMILGAIGSWGTIICGIMDLTGKANGQPQPNAGGQEQSGGQPRITVNEQMSQAAQYEFNKRLEAYRAEGKEINECTEAALFAQAVELQTLKAPLSAVFCAIEQMNTVYDPTSGVYTVNGFVDAQNSYGAMVRTPFSLKVMKSFDGSWKCVSAFVNTAQQVQATVAANTFIYWIIGLVVAAALTGLGYLFFKVIL